MRKDKRPATPSSEGLVAGNGQNGHASAAEVVSAESLRQSLRVKFADGLVFDIRYAKIGIDSAAVDVGTLKLLLGGAGVVFLDKEGEPFPIDGATLRYLADPEYARKVDQRIEAIRLPADRLDRLIEKSGPPAEWYDSPESKLF
jgi:hypothetical protein